ncbi:hypothetical protein MPDQ_006664 [Monascus purpureus]|uniref:Uncharacterized protein n=1 Tax=Monascus purpureus TaxID=5098 RepID=A0A507QXF5_MONPU|nr:hypothetical protein MPDQ_006664 [Monascus purpureus]
MVVPKPPVKLEGHCSAIHENTLYVYSANGFASLPLQLNGTWSKLTMGESVSGAACVKGGVDGDSNREALYVVGGTGGSSDYSGVQRYTFDDRRWETISLTTPITQNRTHHGVAFLKSSSSILVYAGSQEDSTTSSSQTFSIFTAPPYNISSFEGQGVSPASSPVLLPWNDEEAALMGGSTSSNIFLFAQARGWQDSGLTLSKTLSSGTGYTILSRTDGSKVLQSFNMEVSPNTVSSVPLLGPDAYNDTLAPTTTRLDYSLAQDESSNLVVISGGDDADPLVIFNQTSNGWINATKLFYGDESLSQIPLQTTSTPTAQPTTTSTPSTESTAGGSHTNVGTIIGAVLGSLIGFAILLLAILLFLRYRRKKADLKRGRENDDRLSFQDRGIEPLAEAAYPMARSPVPVAASSVDSLGIFSGKIGNEKSLRPPAANTTPMKSSPLITVESDQAGDANSNNLEKSLGVESSGRPGDRTTDVSWSKYFEGNATTNLATLQNSDSPTASIITKSDYRGSAWPSVTPLDFGFLEQPKPLRKVASGSPTTEHAGIDGNSRGLVIFESQSARISSAESMSSEEDYYEKDDFVPDDILASAHGNRDTLGTGSWFGRPPSSMYSRSGTDLPSTGASASGGQPRQTGATNALARKSSVLIPDQLPGVIGGNVNSDLSWLDLNAGR